MSTARSRGTQLVRKSTIVDSHGRGPMARRQLIRRRPIFGFYGRGRTARGQLDQRFTHPSPSSQGRHYPYTTEQKLVFFVLDVIVWMGYGAVLGRNGDTTHPNNAVAVCFHRVLLSCVPAIPSDSPSNRKEIS